MYATICPRNVHRKMDCSIIQSLLAISFSNMLSNMLFEAYHYDTTFNFFVVVKRQEKLALSS